MKTVQLQGENLNTQFSRAIAINNKMIASTSMSVTFIEDNKTQEAVLLLSTKGSSQYKQKTEKITCIAGEIVTKKLSRLCIVHCHNKGKIKEFWMTTIESKSKK